MRIIDCHCHVYPEKIAHKAPAGIMQFYPGIVFELGDAPATVKTMQREEQKAGIGHQVIFSVATKVSQVDSINDFIAEEVSRSGGTLTGLGSIHPDSPTVEADIEGILRRGLKGVKLHPDFQEFAIDDPRCMRIYESLEGRLPVLIHCGDRRFDRSNPIHMAPVLERFPNLTVIGAHFGGWSVWEDAVERLSQYPNFYVDSSSTLYTVSREQALGMIARYGADRILFGTDFPMWSPAAELKRFLSLGLSEAENEKILQKNAERIFGIPEMN